MPGGFSATSHAAAALSRMILERTIIRYETNFDAVRRLGAAPEVVVWIRAQDDLSLARTGKRVREALYPFMKGVKVTACSEPQAGQERSLCGND